MTSHPLYGLRDGLRGFRGLRDEPLVDPQHGSMNGFVLYRSAGSRVREFDRPRGSRDAARGAPGGGSGVDGSGTGIRRCHKQDVFVRRIQRALGVSLDGVRCHIVEPGAMGGIMSRHGWNRDDARGVVGFQVNEDIYVLSSTPWTVLHELVHRAGINADRISRYVAEGLTEAIASDMKESPDEHQPTYPEEVAWVRGTLLPLLGMTAVQLGQVVAKASDPPRALVDLIVKQRPDVDRARLLDELRPQKQGRPSLNLSRNVVAGVSPGQRLHADGWALGIGAAFLTAGAVLIFATQGADHG